jgi:hypothetical protein
VGTSTLRVDTAEMAENPLDDHGVPQVDPGDHVSVTGTVDVHFFEARELTADSVLTLTNTQART